MSKPIQIPVEQGLPLGTPLPPKNARRSSEIAPIFDNDDGHLITFAPTGAGKGMSCINPRAIREFLLR